MADYDTSIRVNTKVDNSDLKKIEESFNQIEKAAGGAGSKIKKLEGSWDSLSVRAQDYRSRLEDLERKGFGFGDEAYDELYIKWKNIIDAEKEYITNLNKQTDKGRADEVARVAKEQERQAEAQRKIEEIAERNLQKENARLEKEVQIEAKIQAEAAEQARLNSIRDNAVVADEHMVELLQRQAELKAYLIDLQKAGVTAGYEQYDSTTNELQQINSEIIARKKLSQSIREGQEGFKKLSESSRKCFKTIHDGTKKSNGLLSSMGSRLKGIALSLLVFNWITKGFNAMVQAMKEGFRNLAQYSNDYNQSISDLKSSTAQLKNGLAAAFEPIANTLIPYLTRLVEWLNVATDAVGQFLAAMQGKSTYTKAKKQAVDYAKSLDTASKSAKRALASFDQLNVLSKNDSNTGSGEVVGAEAFETGQVESQITSFVERIKEALQPFKESVSNWFQDVDFSPLIDSLNRLKEACEPFSGYIYEGMLWLLNNVLQPLGSWVIEDALPKFIELLTSGMEALDKVLVALRPTFDYIWNNILVPIGSFTGEVLLWAIDAIKEAFKGLADLFVEHGDGINLILTSIGKVFEVLWVSYIKPTLQFIMGALKTLLQYIIDIAGDVIDILAGIIDFVVGVFTGDWERAWNGLVNIFKGIINGIIDIFEGVVNSIIDGLNYISIDIPEWVPGHGGETFGFDIARLELPRLAEGAVIPGGRPFAAILGDQRAGQTNIEAPLATIVDAVKQAMAENGGGAGGSYTFVAQLDGRTIYEETIRLDQMEYNATGKSGFQY